MIDKDYYDSRVSHPGKFEGEDPATPYFYDQALNGDGETLDWQSDGIGNAADLFCFVDSDEAEAFGLEIGSAFVIVEMSDGFVIGKSFDNEDAARDWYAEWSAPESL